MYHKLSGSEHLFITSQFYRAEIQLDFLLVASQSQSQSADRAGFISGDKREEESASKPIQVVDKIQLLAAMGLSPYGLAGC